MQPRQSGLAEDRLDLTSVARAPGNMQSFHIKFSSAVGRGALKLETYTLFLWYKSQYA